MARPRIHATAADRQRAYRARMATRQTATTPTPTKSRRLPSRPARLTTLESSVRELLVEYQTWLESLPKSLEDSGQAERLREVIEQLEDAADLLAEVQPPRGFGRD